MRLKIKNFLEEWGFVLWFSLGMIGMIGMGYIAFSPISEIQAAPAIKYQEPGCEKLGIVGTIEVDRCTDGVNVWLANSAGMISSTSK